MVCFLSVTFSGCASNRLVDTWKDPGYKRGSINKVLVVAMINDNLKRRVWEDAFVNAFSRGGLSAEPSYRYFQKQLPDEDTLKDKAQTTGFGGMFVINQTGQRIETYKTASRTTINTDHKNNIDYRNSADYRDRRRLGGPSSTTVIEKTPGRIEKERIVSYQTKLLDVKGDFNQIWTGSSEGVDSGAAKDVSGELSELVTVELKNAQIF